MTKLRVLFISSEITPYLPETEMSYIGRYLPQGIQEKGKEIRTFMPRFGCINERRNQLHEVIRLSGMNQIINDTDHPLIIKVASIQAARMQVYFIDNEDYFQRKHTLYDVDEKLLEDNDERAIFFARGVFETVKKLRWNPDLIYCQGWFSGLVPLYLKKVYQKDPTFANAKVVYSTAHDTFEGCLNKNFAQKTLWEEVVADDVKLIKEPTYINVNKLAMEYSDGVIFNTPDLSEELKDFAVKNNKPFIMYSDRDHYVDEYDEFFEKVAAE